MPNFAIFANPLVPSHSLRYDASILFLALQLRHLANYGELASSPDEGSLLEIRTTRRDYQTTIGNRTSRSTWQILGSCFYATKAQRVEVAAVYCDHPLGSRP
jgi:hypothetical protein